MLKKRLTILLNLFLFCSLIGCSTNSTKPKEKLQFKDSMDAYSHYVNHYPENQEPLYYRAKYFIRAGNINGAMQDITKALFLDSTDLRFHNTYANLQLATLNLDEVKYHYKFVIERDSQNVEALIGMAKLYALLNNYPMANSVYLNKVLTIDPYNADAYFLRGMIYLSEFTESQNPEGLRRSLSSFQTTIEQDPQYYSAYIQMGVIFDQLDSSIAIQYYNSALEVFPASTEALYNKGMFFQKKGSVDSALYQYKKIINIDSSYAKAYYNQGYIHLIMTDVLDSALYYFKESIVHYPNYYQAYNNIGLTYEKLGNKEAAKVNYKKAIAINPDFRLAKDNLNAVLRK